MSKETDKLIKQIEIECVFWNYDMYDSISSLNEWRALKSHIQSQQDRINELIKECDVVYEESQRDKVKLDKIAPSNIYEDDYKNANKNKYLNTISRLNDLIELQQSKLDKIAEKCIELDNLTVGEVNNGIQYNISGEIKSIIKEDKDESIDDSNETELG